MKSVLYGILALIIGPVLFFGGLTMDRGEVKCGSRVMSPGDTCTEIRNGSTTAVRSYDEQAAENGQTRIALMIIGPLIAVGGVFMLLPASVLRRRPAAHPQYAPPPMPYQQPAPHPQYPAQPQQGHYPPQQPYAAPQQPYAQQPPPYGGAQPPHWS